MLFMIIITKNKCLIFIVISGIFSSTYGQNKFIAEYHVATNRNQTIANVDADYVLMYDGSMSLFKPNSDDPLDKLYFKEELNVSYDNNNLKVVNQGNSQATTFLDYHYIDHNLREVYFNMSISGSMIHIKRSLPKLNWELVSTPMDTTIAGQKVKKAYVDFMGRQYEAYYAPDIITVAAPFKFTGLPGLVVALKSLDGFVSINLLSYKTVEDLIIPFEKAEKVVSFDKYKSWLRKDSEEKMKALASKLSSDDDGGQIVIEFKAYMEIPDIEPVIIEY